MILPTVAALAMQPQEPPRVLLPQRHIIRPSTDDLARFGAAGAMLPFAAPGFGKGSSGGGGGGGAWTTVLTPGGDTPNNGWSGFTMRQSIAAAALTDATGTAIRISLRSGAGGCIIGKCYFGPKGAGTYDFAAAPTQVLFSGAAGITVASATVFVTDAITYSYTGTVDLMLSVYFSGTSDMTMKALATGSNGFKAGDDAITTLAAGYSNSAQNNAIALVEAFV